MTSNLGAMREIATPDCAVLVDPYDVNDIRGGIERLSGDDDLCRRLSKAGRARVEVFSWARYQDALGNVYRRIAG
jgi:glycosyltransferase involved in cell wall biosynthesis